MNMNEELTSSDLAGFVGVQDVPDGGYDIKDVTYAEGVSFGLSDRVAEVRVDLNYSGGMVQKVFLLSRNNNGWKIDGVENSETK